MGVIKDPRLFFLSLSSSFKFGQKTLGPGDTGWPGCWLGPCLHPYISPVESLTGLSSEDKGCKGQIGSYARSTSNFCPGLTFLLS